MRASTESPDLDAHLRETRLQSHAVFDGSFLHVKRDSVRLPNGGEVTREYIVHPGAVVIIAIAEPGERLRLTLDGPIVEVQARSVILERQFRYPVGQVITEFPAGKRDAGEASWLTAQRELREETGFTAQHWALAATLMPAIAYADEVIEIWFAKGLQQQGRQLDEEEFLDVQLVEVDTLRQWCLAQRLPDAKSVTCLWWLEQWCAGRLSLDWLPAAPA